MVVSTYTSSQFSKVKSKCGQSFSILYTSTVTYHNSS